MITQVFKNYLVNYVKISYFLWFSPVCWNRSLIVRFANKKRLRVLKAQRISFTIYVLGMVQGVFTGDATTDLKLQSMALVPIFVALLALIWMWGLTIAPAQLFNSISNFEDVLIKEYGQVISWKGRSRITRVSTKGMVIFNDILYITLFSAPFLNFALVLHNPCQPPFLGSMTGFCKGGLWSDSTAAYILRLPIAFCDLWCCFLCNTGGGVFILMFFAICVTSFLEYLDVVWRYLDQASMSSKFRVITCIRIYKKICVVERMLNATFSSFAFPTLVFSCTGIQILSGFVSISRHSLIPMPQFLLYPLVWLNSIVFLTFIITLAANVHSCSARLIENLAKLRHKFKFRFGRKLVNRELTSCCPLKIKFGNNFVSGMTPLVNQDIAWNQTMSLMLLRKS